MDLKGREIFAVGKWNGMTFTESQLDDIVTNFETLKDIHKVPLKFGHNDEQEITDGQPAIGWISKVYREGKKLLADFTDVPSTVLNAMKKKLYRTVSIELLFDVERSDGQKFKNVLDAVAILGADHPAVNTLEDLDKLLAMRTDFTGGHKSCFETVAGTVKKFDSKEKLMDNEKDVQALIDKALKPLADANAKLTTDLATANATIAKFTSDAEDEAKAAKEKAIKMARESVIEVLDAAVKGQTMTPAQREVYEKQIGLDDDDRVVSINVEEIKTMFSVSLKDEESGKTGDDEEISDNPGEQMLSLTNKYQADHGEKNFKVAFSAICNANPKLHKAYLNSNGEV